MGIKRIYHEHTNVFGFEVTGKLTSEEIEKFLPELEEGVAQSHKKFRLLIDVTKMDKADLKSEWDMFEFLKEHMNDIEFIAIVGAHSWTKVMSEILTESVFVRAETLYFKPDQIEQAWTWLTKASHPRNVPVQKYIHSDKGLFTKYGSPDYI